MTKKEAYRRIKMLQMETEYSRTIKKITELEYQQIMELLENLKREI